MIARPTDRDLADFLLVLWARRYLLVFCTVFAAALALTVSLWLPKTYRATATLMIAGSKVPTVTVGEATRPDSRVYADTYAELLRSRSIASRVVRELQLDRAPHWLSEESLSRNLAIRAIPGTLLLTVSLNMLDPELAARVVNTQTSQAVELSKTIATNELTDTRRYLEVQVASAKTDLDRQQEVLRELKSRLRYEESSKQLEYLLRQRGDLESGLSDAEQRSSQAEAEVKAFDKALQGQTRTVTLTRSLVQDPVFKDAVQAATGRETRDLLGVQMKSEELNPLLNVSEPERVRALAVAAGVAARRTTLQKHLAENEKAIRGLERELADKQAVWLAVHREYDLARSAYENFAKSYESARLSVAAQAAELKIVDPAAPGRQPVGPRVLLNVVIATTTSFILCLFAILLIDHLRAARSAQAGTRDLRGAPDAPVTLRSSR